MFTCRGSDVRCGSAGAVWKLSTATHARRGLNQGSPRTCIAVGDANVEGLGLRVIHLHAGNIHVEVLELLDARSPVTWSNAGLAHVAPLLPPAPELETL